MFLFVKVCVDWIKGMVIIVVVLDFIEDGYWVNFSDV